MDTFRFKWNKSCKIKNILMIARLDPIKDQETLIKAFSKLKFPNWKLKIVGQGSNFYYLRDLSLKLSLNPDEIFVGTTNNVAKLLGESEIFAFSTTEFEGFGKVLIEAMANVQLLLAMFLLSGNPLEGKAGLLVKPKSVESEKNLGKLIQDSSYRSRLSENLGNLVKVRL